jgi:hypothetical protein
VPSSTDPIRVVASIVRQLERTVPGYGDLVAAPGRRWIAIDDADDPVLDHVDPRRAFDRTIRIPLEILASTGRLTADVIVVVDGLDEARPECGSALLDLLAPGEAGLPPRMRLLLTSRPGAFVDRIAPPALLDLLADRPAGVDEVDQYLATIDGLSPRVRREISAAAGGNFVYVDLALRLHESGGLKLARGRAPGGLAELYRRVLDPELDHASLARTVLGVLATGRDLGFTALQVATMLKAPRDHVADLVAQWHPVLAGTRQIRPHHRCLAEHLAATMPEAAEVDWRLSQAWLRRWQTQWRACDQPYVLRHMLTHLADVMVTTSESDRRAAATAAIEQSLADPDFLTTALARVGVDDVLSALAYLRRRLAQPDLAVENTVAVLRTQTSTLRLARRERDASLAAQQLVFEATTIGASGLSRALSDQIGGRVLTLWATTSSPFRFAPNARPGHGAAVADVSMPSSGTHAVTTSRDGTTRVWLLASGRMSAELPTGTDVASPDGSRVVTQARDGTASLWNVHTGEHLQTRTGRGTLVTAIAVNDAGTIWVTGDPDGNATVWDLDVGERVTRLPSRSLVITALAISGDGSTVAIGDYGGGISVWDVATATPRHRFIQSDLVTALALTPAADRLVAGGHRSLTVYPVPAGIADRPGAPEQAVARLVTPYRVTAIAVNPAMPRYVLFGTAAGQVAYIRLPETGSGPE